MLKTKAAKFDDFGDDESISDEPVRKQRKKHDATGPGLANVMEKILNKTVQNKKMIIASKANTEKEITKKKKLKKIVTADYEVVNNNKEVVKAEPQAADVDESSSEDEEDLSDRRRKHESVGRSLPRPSRKEKDFTKIATKGVVQLFNAVRQQQHELSAKITEAGASIAKKDKVLTSVSKNDFLKLLRSD